MRQLLAQIPQGHGAEALHIAQRHEAINLACWQGAGAEGGAVDVVLMHVSNGQVGALIDELERLPQLQVTLVPQGVITLRPPPDQAPQQVKDVRLLSSVEVFLSGLQSVGSWRGFLGYAAISGIVVWIGLFTERVYLLTAAMLIAPYAGPAMNVAVATARGDKSLLGRGLLRYSAALVVSALVAALLSLLLQQRIATELMVQVSELSSVAVLLPLAAGAAGALNQIQSQRASLVSGAATGMLVAASLAPPVGIVGMATVLGEWAMVKSGLFLLVLQLVGINLSGAIVFRLAGLSSQGPRYARGERWVAVASAAATVMALAAMLAWQVWTSPELQRSSRAQRAAAEVKDVVNHSGLAHLVDAQVRFTRADIPGQNSLLCVLWVQPSRGVQAIASDQIRRQLTESIEERLRQRFNVTPLVDLTVLRE